MRTPTIHNLVRNHINTLRGGACLLLAVVLGSATAQARNSIRQAFFQNYPTALGTVLDTVPSKPGHCGVCHYKFGGGGTRNPYGVAVGNNGANSNAIWVIRNQDSDGDGFANMAEANTNRTTYANMPTFPGYTNTAGITEVTLSDIAGYLVPVVGGDTTPPSVAVTKPNSGGTFIANQWTNITWTASDASGVAAIDIFLSLDDGASYDQIARGLDNSGNYPWVPADRPSTQAWIKIVAKDTYGNTNFDVSDVVFTIQSPDFTNAHGVATKLTDFDMPGTQPFEHGPEFPSSASCAQCHGNYNTASEPYFNWQGGMMSHAARDPLFLANLSIANQDAANSGDICLRCHFSRGWLGGRSVPTDGKRMISPDDYEGVNCALCHGMVDPVYTAGVSPTNDLAVHAGLSFPGTEYGNGMFVIDPSGVRRGPYADAVVGHESLGSAFHRSAAFCGTCHDVSNPAFTKDAQGVYQVNTPDAPADNFSPHFIAPVERTYSEWLASDYNSPTGVYAPQFAGNRPDGRVSTCQHCHMRSTSAYAASTNVNPGIPLRTDMGVHDQTGGSTWLPGLLTNLYPGEVSAAAIQAGIARANYMLQNAAKLAVGDEAGQLKVTVTNETGHKLPTGYPEGRRIWLNVKFYDEGMNLVDESGAYNPTNGVLSRDVQAKIYEVHPGIDTNISGVLDLEAAASLHFVLNNKTYEDNRIPPRGFTNAAFALFGGEPVGHHYDDGQYWDDTRYTLPAGATRADVKLYYQSTSKEFIEFLRDENRTDTNGVAMYNLWNENGKCPPTLMAETTWVTAFLLKSAQRTPEGKFRIEFLSRPGLSYTIKFKNSLSDVGWTDFKANGTFTATGTSSSFEDDFSDNSSGGSSPTRYYRIEYSAP